MVLCGIETHACIHETALDLLERGFGVHVVVDACSSRSMLDRSVRATREWSNVVENCPLGKIVPNFEFCGLFCHIPSSIYTVIIIM